MELTVEIATDTSAVMSLRSFTEKRNRTNGHVSPARLSLKPMCTVDLDAEVKMDRLRLARERREERERNQAMQEQALRERDERARQQYARALEERSRRMQQQRQRAELRRAAVEENRRMREEEEKVTKTVPLSPALPYT
ncbi:hypothetical protein AGOR_G00141850 [Albula goreensis]|uniref:Ensconsin-like n=1 Tax=Albula goreensis TaxID=1534307 RepID=A0A8T3D3T6_9TELE|nr:hypothetical protein AGOR_G00141850 [Albula goreensis]